MRYVTTVICCLAFAIAGISLAIHDNNSKTFGFNKHQMLSAATVPDCQVKMLPLDVQLDLGKRFSKTDTVTIHDTTFVDRPEVLVINKKSSRVRSLKKATVSNQGMFIPEQLSDSTVNNKGTPDREEQTGEFVISPKEVSIQLTVDGVVVYSKDVNHSTGEP